VTAADYKFNYDYEQIDASPLSGSDITFMAQLTGKRKRVSGICLGLMTEGAELTYIRPRRL